MKVLLSALIAMMALGSTAMATTVTDCPNGTWPVAQYDIHGNFLGYKCERMRDFSAAFALPGAALVDGDAVSCRVDQYPVAQYDLHGNFLGYKCEGNGH